MTRFPQVKKLTTAAAFDARCAELGIELPRVGEPGAAVRAVAEPLEVAGHRVGNRFCILPMEGWDATADGAVTDLVRRRWARFGESGAKLIWGGEAVAVRPDGRANPHQLRLGTDTVEDIADLRVGLVAAHEALHGTSDDLLVGLQLTHSGRFARPDGDPAPQTAYRHPVLDPRLGIADSAAVLSDDELDELVGDVVVAAVLARQAGFAFVDVKHCHGYLGHELLSGVDRPGRYGGDLAGRTRFLRSIVEGIRTDAPGLGIGVRLSAFDMVPYRHGDERGEPDLEPGQAYPYAFGGDGTGLGVDLTETHLFCELLSELDIELLCVTAGSPYYVPHIQRPAYFPPSDGYAPPEDPLVGVARMLAAARELTTAHPGLTVVASGLSYLQEWIGPVAEGLVADGWCHSVGLGRVALSYPLLPADVLAGREPERQLVCRTFSDCTTAPRNGLVSGCYPLDPFYKDRPERVELAAAKRASREALGPPPPR